jgi:uncharacterized protein involved in tolerance to divalent cations
MSYNAESTEMAKSLWKTSFIFCKKIINMQRQIKQWAKKIGEASELKFTTMPGGVG